MFNNDLVFVNIESLNICLLFFNSESLLCCVELGLRRTHVLSVPCIICNPERYPSRSGAVRNNNWRWGLDINMAPNLKHVLKSSDTSFCCQCQFFPRSLLNFKGVKVCQSRLFDYLRFFIWFLDKTIQNHWKTKEKQMKPKNAKKTLKTQRKNKNNENQWRTKENKWKKTIKKQLATRESKKKQKKHCI